MGCRWWGGGVLGRVWEVCSAAVACGGCLVLVVYFYGWLVEYHRAICMH